MPTTTRVGRLVACIKELPSIKSHDPLIMWSCDFDFSYTICRLTVERKHLSHRIVALFVSLAFHLFISVNCIITISSVLSYLDITL